MQVLHLIRVPEENNFMKGNDSKVKNIAFSSIADQTNTEN